MPLVDALLPEFDHEMTTTRKALERVPEDKFDWKPHAKSFSLGALATHLANLPTWGTETLTKSEIDLPAFDRNVAAARAAMTGKTDGELLAIWSLKRGGKTLFSMPKTAVLRSFVLSHIIHHRAQLGVYLRLLDVPVPATYGPTADEPSF